MSLDAFVGRLAACRKVGLDRGTFEAWLRGDARRGPLGLTLFERVEAGRLAAVTSVLTLSDLLVAPVKAHDDAAAEELQALLPTYPHLDLAPVTLAVATRAATYRGRYDLDPMAAIQVATAKEERAELLVTTEAAWKRLSGEIDVLVLDDFVDR